MSLRALAFDWSLDGPVGAAFLVLLIAAGALYLGSAAEGRRRDRRGRRWPRRRSACFLAGLAILVLDLYSGIGSQADTWLSVHMVEHMVMWVVVAPLLAAGAPVRLALYSLPRAGREPARARAPVAARRRGDRPRWVSHSVLRRPARYSRARGLRPRPQRRLRPRSCARSLPPDGPNRVGAANRCRPPPSPTRAARPVRLYGRLHGAHGTDRSLAGNRVPSRLRALRPGRWTSSASRPEDRGDDHVGRMPAGFRGARAEAHPPPPTPSGRVSLKVRHTDMKQPR